MTKPVTVWQLRIFYEEIKPLFGVNRTTCRGIWTNIQLVLFNCFFYTINNDELHICVFTSSEMEPELKTGYSILSLFWIDGHEKRLSLISTACELKNDSSNVQQKNLTSLGSIFVLQSVKNAHFVVEWQYLQLTANIKSWFNNLTTKL